MGEEDDRRDLVLQILSETYIAVLVVVFLGLSIFVHEFGHFIAARLCGMVVETFSLGLGPALWKRKYKGIIYKIGWIPFGGYVALPQIDPTGMQGIQGDEGGDDTGKKAAEPLPRAAAWKKIVVSVSGGLGNIILAIIAAWLVFWLGMPAVGAHQDAVIGFVDTTSAAYEVGVRVGDEVLSVDGEAVERWADVSQACVTHTQVTFEVRSADGATKHIAIPTKAIKPDIYQVDGVVGTSLCLVGGVHEGRRAHKAGIKRGDIVMELDGIRIFSVDHLISLINKRGGKQVPITVQRDNKRVEKLVAPESVILVKSLLKRSQAFESGLEAGRLILSINGKSIKTQADLDRWLAATNTVEMSAGPNGETKHLTILGKKSGSNWELEGVEYSNAIIGVTFDTKVHPTPGEQLTYHATLIFRVLRKLVTPRTSRDTAKQLGGPGAIMANYRALIQTSIALAIWFTGLLNINLAIINLLPIPVLDGGHIVFAAWEGIVGKPVSPRVINVLVNVFVVLLITAFVLLTYRDIIRFTPAKSFVTRLLKRDKKETNAVPAAIEQELGATNDVVNSEATP